MPIPEKERLARQRLASRKWRNKNRKRMRAMVKSWQSRNPEACKKHAKTSYRRHKEKRLNHQREWYLRNKKAIQRRQQILRFKEPEMRMFHSSKCRAKKHGVPFSISVKHIIIPKRCPALGIKLKINNSHAKDSSPSLDRIIPSLGYVPGNVIVISHRANRIKNNSSIGEFLMMAQFLSSIIKTK